MANLRQSAAYTRMFLMVQSGDHTTPATGLTVTVTISKAGNVFAAAGGAVSEVANGWYKVALNTTDTNAMGELAYHCTATGADPTDFVDQVTAQILGDSLTANLMQIVGTGLTGFSVDTATYTSTTTDFETNLATTYDMNSYIGQCIYFTVGNHVQLIGKTFRISNAVVSGNSKVKLTVSTMPVAPPNGNQFIILGRIGA